jgi:hypothetical protein
VKNIKSDISGVEVKALNVFSREASQLSSVEFEKEIPWPIRRVFFIASQEDLERGNHAHKECIQAIICLTGEVDVYCSDGLEEKCFRLLKLSELLVVPPGIWVKLNFRPGSSITVLASQEYAEIDYIRSWEEFQAYRLSL